MLQIDISSNTKTRNSNVRVTQA